MKLTKKQEKVYNYLLNKPGYLKKSSDWIFNNTKVDTISDNIYDLDKALKQARIDYKTISNVFDTVVPLQEEVSLKSITTSKHYNVRGEISSKNYNVNKNQSLDNDNVLFVADLHSPWILDGYLDFCKEQQEKYKCGTVIFSGDIIDGHAWSYHESDVDGMSVGDELHAAKKQLKEVYKLFPTAHSLLGNHDLLISRKARTAGLSKHFIKDFGDVIEAPHGWSFSYELIKDNVRYIHGSIGNAFKRAVNSRMSTCQGHLHSETFVQWSVSEKDAIFGLQVGGGFDRDKYAFDYGKPFTKKPIIGCGLVLDKGTTPLVKLMPL